MLKKVALIVMTIFPTAGVALAKKASTYVPPPYIDRLGISFYTLLPVAAVLVIFSHYSFRRFCPSPAKEAILRTGILAMLVLAIAAFWAACDDWNDEGWNPVMDGGLVLGFLPATDVLWQATRLSFTKRGVIYLLLLTSFVPLLQIVLPYWQDLLDYGRFPASW
jgi:hypothetical protein